MANSYFQFKQFTIHQDKCGMKVTTDGCLFGAWVAGRLESGAGNILDIGTGTGLLTLMMAQQSKFFIDAIEIDKDAFEQASDNVAASPWANRIKVFHADAKKLVAKNKYDVIISNPPFYEKELKGDDAQKNLAHHDAGLLLPELLHIIQENLKPGGIFYLLLPYKRNDEVKQLLTANDFTIEQMTFVRQSFNHDYFRIMLAGKFKTAKSAETLIDEIPIKDKQDNYSPVFISLLRDYYLHL
jgi:tRNA1Val (adenine37-N6)-methyltransferase